MKLCLCRLLLGCVISLVACLARGLPLIGCVLPRGTARLDLEQRGLIGPVGCLYLEQRGPVMELHTGLIELRRGELHVSRCRAVRLCLGCVHRIDAAYGALQLEVS